MAEFATVIQDLLHSDLYFKTRSLGNLLISYPNVITITIIITLNYFKLFYMRRVCYVPSLYGPSLLWAKFVISRYSVVKLNSEVVKLNSERK